MSRYLVTGGSGRLGRSVVAVLIDAGHEVISVDRHLRQESTGQHRAVDLNDAAATRALFAEVKPDAVVHLAAIAVPFEYPDADIFAINTALAFNVLEASLENNVGSLLLTSSPTVIGYGAPSGWEPQYLPLDESHPVAPWNGYSLSKLAVEEIAAMAVRQHGDRLNIGVFRPCYVIAPEEWEGALTQQGHTVGDRLDQPELSAVALFNYVDARDAGDFVLAWLQRANEIPNGSVFFVSAPDALAREPIAALAAKYRPELAEKSSSLRDNNGVFSSTLANDLLGWRATRTWRTQLSLDGAL